MADRDDSSLQQPAVKLDATYGILARGQGEANAAKRDVQRVKGRETARVLARNEAQIADHLGRDPACTEFVAWKNLSVENQAFHPALPQTPRTGRARRSSTNDQDLCVMHRRLLAGGLVSSW
jgi:hypothetical protein